MSCYRQNILFKGLTSGGKELTWFPMAADEEEDAAIRKRRLLSRVDDLLKLEKERSGRVASTDFANETSFNATEGGAASKGNLDFVAKLWDILKCCGSSVELQVKLRNSPPPPPPPTVNHTLTEDIFRRTHFRILMHYRAQSKPIFIFRNV